MSGNQVPLYLCRPKGRLFMMNKNSYGYHGQSGNQLGNIIWLRHPVSNMIQIVSLLISFLLQKIQSGLYSGFFTQAEPALSVRLELLSN